MYYGWYVVITAMFIAAVTTGARNGFGVFIIPMSDAFDWSRTTISIAAATGWLVNGVTQPLVGHVFDRYNSRRVILVSLVVAGLATAALAFTFHILFLVFMFSFVLSAAMSGASIGTLGPLLARWFQRKRTTVLGLVVAGSSMGGLLLVPFSAYLVEVTNWRTSWAVLGFIIIAVALPLALFFLRSRPSDLGLQPDGDPDPAQNTALERRRGLFEVDQWWRSFNSRPIWHLSASYTVCGVTVGLISIHFVPYAVEHVGVSPNYGRNHLRVHDGVERVGRHRRRYSGRPFRAKERSRGRVLCTIHRLRRVDRRLDSGPARYLYSHTRGLSRPP